MKYSDGVSLSSSTKDHAEFAGKWLAESEFGNKWQVVVADDHTLQIDYDELPYSGDADNLPEQFGRVLEILMQTYSSPVTINYEVLASKGGNTHVIVHLPVPLSEPRRIAWQAAFGSDPVREALHMLSIERGELNPILLFMRKPEPKLLTEGSHDPLCAIRYVNASTCTCETKSKFISENVMP